VPGLEPIPTGEGTFRWEGADNGASVSGFVVRSLPGEGPVLHQHPYEEVFVLEGGRATFTVGDQTVELEPGQMLVAPANTPHKFLNSGEEPLRMVAIHPAPRMEQEDLPEGG
jgi:mannose-6-phosphate isomerase-like protein (cupin superfamily)